MLQLPHPPRRSYRQLVYQPILGTMEKTTLKHSGCISASVAHAPITGCRASYSLYKAKRFVFDGTTVEDSMLTLTT
jgi:hypothetical protein